ncbi:terminase small subunit [Staphylococcus epidermidis]|uniref:terminase small subunit n=1 Tax=Staphylococcus epidermidis TaxID=1282 RepID=UPI0011A92E4F|nr:terminase small subunit [Staphylococcus epidermidis]KAB2223762.1 terminase small subunit [Staphylococcus epidermidis]MCG2217563.1 terminase small subunit [Staphylococcus epidermidis]MCM3102559.1 terminase small subunit [Staphylococcus epidermidis]
MTNLTPKQERFVNEYIRTLNVTQSAITAGYSPKTAHVTGCRLLKKKHINDYIQEQKKKVIDESVLSANELLHLLTNSAIGDETETKEVVVKRGEYKENPQNGKVQLVYNEYVQLVEVPIKPSDRLKARDMLGKYHKLFTERKEFTGDTPVIVNIGEWDEGDEEDKQRELDKIKENYPNRTMIVDNIPLED